MRLFKAIAVLVLAGALTACGGGAFRTHYEKGVDPALARQLSIRQVEMRVPQSLKVSEARRIFPFGDIVWREDPPGDRHQQVGVIVQAAAKAAVRPTHGGRPAILRLTLVRFHALSFEAEAKLSNAGVHNIDFVAELRDARTGALLAGPEYIEAALPAKVGPEMIEARLRGESQRSQITAHLTATIAAWLGIGPDIRGTFRRAGG